MELVVGVVIRPHGVRGEVLVDVRTDEPEARLVPGAVLDTDPAEPGPLTLESVRRHTSGGRNRLLVAFEEILDRDDADTLRGVALQVESEQVPGTDDPDEFHDHDLVGLAAVSASGEALGEVVRVEHAPASDLLVLRKVDGGQALVPFVRQIVPSVDLEAGTVVLTPPAGLLEL